MYRAVDLSSRSPFLSWNRTFSVRQTLCAGRNNVKKNHFETRFFREFLGLLRDDSDVLFAALHPPSKGGGGLVFAPVLDNPLLSSSVGHNGTPRGQPAPNSPLRNRKRPHFRLENRLGRSQSLCHVCYGLQPNFLNVGGDSSHDISGPFHHLGHFFVLNSFDDKLVWKIDSVSSPYVITTNSFILADILQLWRVQRWQWARLRHSLDLGGGMVVSKMVGPALPAQRLTGAGRHLKLPNRE